MAPDRPVRLVPKNQKQVNHGIYYIVVQNYTSFVLENLFTFSFTKHPLFLEDSLSEELEELISIEDRSDMDFSDLLWNCLIKVESYAQLSSAITYIIKTIQAAELRPFVS